MPAKIKLRLLKTAKAESLANLIVRRNVTASIAAAFSHSRPGEGRGLGSQNFQTISCEAPPKSDAPGANGALHKSYDLRDFKRCYAILNKVYSNIMQCPTLERVLNAQTETHDSSRLPRSCSPAQAKTSYEAMSETGSGIRGLVANLPPDIKRCARAIHCCARASQL